MENRLQLSPIFVSKVKGTIGFLVTILMGILLILGSYIYERRQTPRLRYYPFYTQVVSPQKDSSLKEQLEYTCAEMKRDNFTQYEDIKRFNKTDWLISYRFKLIACKNFKVGSTNIARVLYTLDNVPGQRQGDTNNIKKGRARHEAMLENKTQENLDMLLNSYTKFMFIRDPLERLLSAYRDERPREWYKTKPNKISFKIFLEKLLPIPDSEMDSHMVSFTRMCNPCTVKYNFIGSMDNYETDMENLLKSVGANKYVLLPHRNQTGYSERKTNDVLQHYLKDVPKSLIQKVFEKYYWDYFLFGFPKPDL